MGIRGLSTFLLGESNFFRDSELKEGKVIIDGNNARFLIYRGSRGINSALGGDYMKYYQYVRTFFQRLKNCNLEPVVVMDGAYDQSDIKRKTVLKRTSDQAKAATQINTGNQDKLQVLPLFAREVFLEAVKDLDLELIQTNFEADAYMAYLGSINDCPVLTSDSDFFVFPVRMLVLHSIDLDESDETVLQCQEFDKDAFLRHFKLSPSLCCLMASILGNDYISQTAFLQFFSNIHLSKSKRYTLRHRRIQGLLKWLSRESDVDSAIAKILEHLPKTHRASIEAKIRASMAMYLCQKDNFNIAQALDKELHSKRGDPIPRTILDDYQGGLLPSWIVDIYCNEEVFLPSQVENVSAKSAHLGASPVFALIASFLLNSDPDKTVDKIRVFLRERSRTRSVFLELESGLATPASVRLGSIGEKLGFFSSHLGLEGIQLKSGPPGEDVIDANNPFFAWSLYLWSNTTDRPGQKSTMLYCISLYVLLKSLTREGASQWFGLSPTFESRIRMDGVDETQIGQTLKDRFSKTNPDMKTSPKKFPLDPVYEFSQLQATLYQMRVLTKLVAYDHANVLQMHLLWDGTFLYNLHHTLDAYFDLDNRVEALLKFDARLWGLFVQLKSAFEPYIYVLNPAQGTNDGHNPGGKRVRNRHRKRDPNGAEDVENRFHLLSVHDEGEK